MERRVSRARAESRKEGKKGLAPIGVRLFPPIAVHVISSGICVGQVSVLVGTSRNRTSSTKGWSMVGLQMRHLASNVGWNEGYTVISLATTTRKRASSFLHPPIVQQLYGIQGLTYHTYRLLQMHALGQRSIIPIRKGSLYNG